MDHQLSIRQILSFCRTQKILGFLLIICMTGLSFILIEKSPYVKDKPKYETPSNKNLEVYDLYTNLDEDIEHKRLQPSTRIDTTISARLEQGIVWEPIFIQLFQDMLREDRELGLLDLGANIGVYSMIAAAMNRPVVSVEPVEGNLKSLTKAVQINGYQDLITVLPYAITDIRTKLFMSLNANNQAAHGIVVDKEHDIAPEQTKVDVETILMDDLVPYVPFKKAVMKINIEGQEHRAFVHSKALMDKVEFPYIFMEWKLVCKYNETDGTEDNSLTIQLINLLTSYGYTPFKTYIFQKEKIKLDTANWGQWPADIIWSKTDQ